MVSVAQERVEAVDSGDGVGEGFDDVGLVTAMELKTNTGADSDGVAMATESWDRAVMADDDDGETGDDDDRVQ